MKISFLINSAYGMGGTIRSVVTLANELSQRHDVELISVVRSREEPFFPLDSKVRVRFLHDAFELAQPNGHKRRLHRALSKYPSLLMHRRDKAYPRQSLWSDLQMLKAVRQLDSDVLVATRPSLGLFTARWAPKRVATVVQSHTFLYLQHKQLRESMAQLYPRLDCVVSLTPAHEADMRKFLGDQVRHETIPNSVDSRGGPVSTQENKLVIAAGRLAPVKRHRQLIDAFAQVVRKHPDWRLRIYGDGPRMKSLRKRILDLELYNNVFLMGQCQDMDRDFAKASISALSSKSEGLPMTVIEAMACGVPVVSYDCDHGPREIISSGADGLLVENGNPRALASGIMELIEDEPRRRSMAKAAIDTAAEYDRRVVGQRWESLFEELVAEKRALV
ncbi:MAG: glycosyltransferase family 4 protein [Micromonosporaceae bacterium]